MGRSKSKFLPSDVPEVKAGYWWSCDKTFGLGTTSFRVLEGNGKNTFDLVQATVASQPTVLTDNGNIQFRMRKAADSNPSIIATSGSVRAGWTGNTYIAGWFRLPDAAGDITGQGNLFIHRLSANGQTRITFIPLINVTDKLGTVFSADGTATVSNQWATPFTGSFLWLELFIIPGTSIEVNSNFVQLVHTATAVPGATLFDGNAPIGICCRNLSGLANADTTDWATCYYCNGIPSLKNRIRLARYNAPLNLF